MEDIIKEAYIESIKNIRKGDKEEEVKKIQEKIKKAKKIIVATNNQKKFKVIKDIMLKVCNAQIKMIDIDTKFADLTRMPALYKGLLALDTEKADIYISRGRLGVPGSGSMLVILDEKGRILTASLSPSSVIHKENIEKRIKDELIEALKRIGISIN
ncbi:FeGP cofactor biosynthesis guanylyltransferase HcgB family protein [Methanocaldococcus lauensis]|nr:FeGP cofactor biosynthesis guanylyltransferase HcgB family protein [Methanocaldococcus lauensis]